MQSSTESPPPPPGDTPGANTSTASLPSPQIAVGFHGESAEPRPHLESAVSAPVPHSDGFQSPLRHHRRAPSVHREVKVTLNAVTELSESHDGRSHHRINQYIIKDEIGRGSYGAVRLATDQYGNEYAVKEFSKSRLRKRAQSNILRHGPRRPQRFLPRANLNAPLSPHFSDFANDGPPGERRDALFLIREEIAIMKKLNHPNLVQLIEVLDDPEEDSLYMVLEMCKKGVVMKVGLNDQAEPYSEECSRCYFRDLILGIEYLHKQGVIHRDIKPDNLLLTEDDVLKVVDFGVSEMFEKPGDQMMTAKSAGSPAFLPPELCVAKHGDVSGRAADIWSMGICLYCLRYGKIPFERSGVLEMYEAIKTDRHSFPEDENPDFVDMLNRILEKDPKQRIKMSELRNHAWVTKRGTDPLLSEEDNCATLIEPPNALEVNRAFTRKMNHLLCVMKVIQKFKALLAKRRQEASPEGNKPPTPEDTVKNFDPAEQKARAEEIEALLKLRRDFLSQSSNNTHKHEAHGHGNEVKDNDPLFLGIGTGSRDDFAMDKATPDVVADSPTNVDFNVYDKAYEAEIERIMSNPSRQPTVYLTRFVKERDAYKTVGKTSEGSGNVTPTVLSQKDQDLQERILPSSGKFASIVKNLLSEPASEGQS